MSRRTTLVLLVICVITTLAVWIDLRSKRPWFRTNSLTEPLGDLTLAAIERVTIEGRVQPRIVCERADDLWRLSEPIDFPGRYARIESGLVERMREVRSRGLIVAAGEEFDRGRYGLVEPEFTVTLDTQRGPRRLIFGHDHPASGRFYLEIDGGPRPGVHLVDQEIRDIFRRVTVDRLRDDSLCPIIFGEADRVVATGAEHVIDLSLDASGWQVLQPYRSEASPDAVRRLLDILGSWAIESYVRDGVLPENTGEEFGLANPRWRITVTDSTRNIEVTLRIGGDAPPVDGKDMVYVAWEGKPFIFTARARPLPPLRLGPDSFRERELWRLPDPEMARVSVILDRGQETEQRMVATAIPGNGGGSEAVWFMSDGTREFGVDSAWLIELTEYLRAGRVLEFRPRDDDDFSAYGLDEPYLIVELTPVGGESERLVVGDPVPGGRGARFVHNPRWHYLATAFLPAATVLERIPWSFRTPRMHAIPKHRLQAFVLSRGNPEEGYRFELQGRQWFQKNGDPVDPSEIKHIGEALASLQAVAWGPAGEGAPGPDESQCRVDLEGPQGLRSYFWVSEPLAGRARLLRDGDGPWVGRLELQESTSLDPFQLIDHVLKKLED